MLKTTDDPGLETVIAQVLSEMEGFDANSAEFAAMTDQLVKLYALRVKKDPGFSKDTLLTVAANLAGIIAILSFEKAGVITSKALSFVLKAR